MTTRDLTPIETHYKGYRFRSRLEARWAVFFDALNIAWEYEPQGYRLPTRAYLPDFRLRSIGDLWAEVKPDFRSFAGEPFHLIAELAAGTQHGVVLLGGVPEMHWYPVIFGSSDAEHFENDWIDLGQSATKDRPWLACGDYRLDERPPIDELFVGDHWRCAVDAARGARFEHGETIHVPAIWKRPVTRASALVAGAVAGLLPAPKTDDEPLCVRCRASYATGGTPFCDSCRYDPFADEAP